MTSLLVRDPLFTEPFRLMDQLFNRFAGSGERVTGWVPTLDVQVTNDEYVVLVDLPGVKSEDVTVELNDQVLSISGTRVPASIGGAQRTERPYGSFFRTLTLPKGIDGEQIAAQYHDGVLELHVPKPAGLKPRKIEIAGGGKGRQAINA